MIQRTVLVLAEEMGDDEALVVVVALIGSIATAVRLAWQVLPVSRLGAHKWTRAAVLFTPLVALSVLYFLLARWSAQDVRTDWRYLRARPGSGWSRFRVSCSFLPRSACNGNRAQDNRRSEPMPLSASIDACI